jgi:polyisoprenoid-binding protein YceI
MRALRAGLALLLLRAAGALSEEPAPLGPLHYRIEPTGSVLTWELPATLHTVHGKAPEIAGSIDAAPGSAGGWRVGARIVVKAAAMVTGNDKRDRTMREKVLETDRFPDIVFEAREVTADLSRFQPGENLTVEVVGDLTVHGKPAAVRVPVEVHVFPDHVVLQGSFPLSWKQYGVYDPSFGIVTVKDPLRVAFRLRAVESPRGGP